MRAKDDDEAVGAVARNKKRNAALSCAECRRLKLRCDRKFPCSACVKRGCSQICPEGSLTTGKGNRFVLANTESLHDKITELSHRVRSLEDALGTAQKQISHERHPLLSDELLRVKNPLEREVIAEPPKPPEEDDVIDAVGSLSISHTGRTNFYGQTANSWYLLQNEEAESPDEELDEPEADLALPTELAWLSHTFPFAPSVVQAADVLKTSLLGLLPEVGKASQTALCYFENAALQYHPISREEFDERVFRKFYNPGGDSPTDSESFESHRLAILYAVLAVGTLVDLNIRSHSPQATQYYQLAKAALSLDSVLDEPSMPAMQAMLIMSHYLFLADVDYPRWTLMGTVVKLAQSIGLHRDSTRWNLSPEETVKRRKLFWEIYVYDSWQSLTYGRPPSLSMAHIDCKMAHDTTLDAAGNVEMSFDAWKHRFSSECLSIVHDRVFGARTPTYSTVMDLDKRVRSYYVPPSLQVPGFGGSSMFMPGGTEPPTMRLTMQRYLILAIKESTLLYMHRGFFAKAMHDHPEDPLCGKYGQSVLCAHRSASSFIAMMRSLWSQHRALLERMWFLFTHLFSCTIVLGSIPTKCPGMGLARSALQSLDQSVELFSSVSETSRTSKVLPILRKLCERAHASMDEHLAQAKDEVNGMKRETLQDSLYLRQEDEELATLGGKTRLVSPKPQSPSSRGSKSPGPSPTMITTPRLASTPKGSYAEAYAEPMQPFAMNQGYQAQSQSPEMQMYPAQQQMSPLPPQGPGPEMWQPDPSLSMGYMPMPLQTDSAMIGGMANPNQLNFGGYDYISAMHHTYGPAHNYGASGAELLSPPGGDLDIDASWRNWAAQFSST